MRAKVDSLGSAAVWAAAGDTSAPAVTAAPTAPSPTIDATSRRVTIEINRFSGWVEFRHRSYQGATGSESTACRLSRSEIARMLGKSKPLSGDTRLLSSPFGPK